jgi:hypothetical protein
MKIIIDEITYISEKEKARIEGLTKDCLRQRRTRGKYKKEKDFIVLNERVFYKDK